MGSKERDRLFHYAAGVGNEPLKTEIADTDLEKLYDLAVQRGVLLKIAIKQRTLLEKFTAFMGDSEKALMADLSKRLDDETPE